MSIEEDSVSEYLRNETRSLLEAVLDRGVSGRKGRELLFEFFGALPIGIVITAASENIDDSVIQYANPSLLKLVGRSMNDLQGKPRELLLGPDWRAHAEFATYRRRILENGYAQTTIDFVHADSRKIPVSLSTTILKLSVPMPKALRISFVTPIH